MPATELVAGPPAALLAGAAARTRYCFVFPGQGSQQVGMGSDLRGEWPRLGELLARAERLTGRDVSGPMFAGPQETLNDTVAAQLAIFSLSVSVAELLVASDIVPTVVAGHSLGEYAALVSAGWLHVDDALAAVAERAAAMAACCAAHDGAMAAIVGLAPEKLDELCVHDKAIVVVANHNSPKQSVIAGEPGGVDRVSRAALDRGARAAIPLPVGGAFHSPLMAAAEARLAPFIERLALRVGGVPFVSSITGQLVDDVESYRRALSSQITSPVRWARVMTTLQAHDVDVFVEVGPGHALRGLLRHVDRKIIAHPCDGLQACRALAARGAA
jgi:[acyl-carrier-protein] S-malonyltransferase